MLLTHLSHTKVYKNLVLKPEVFAPPIQRLIDDRCEANQFFYTFLLKRENSWFKFRKKTNIKTKTKGAHLWALCGDWAKTPFPPQRIVLQSSPGQL